MPSMPPTLGRRPRIERRREVDRERTQAKPWRRWYWTARWRKKAKAQLEREPMCRMCEAEGVVEAASVADHVVPHRGDPRLFWEGELQSLCKPHHDSVKQREEREGSGRTR